MSCCFFGGFGFTYLVFVSFFFTKGIIHSVRIVLSSYCLRFFVKQINEHIVFYSGLIVCFKLLVVLDVFGST